MSAIKRALYFIFLGILLSVSASPAVAACPPSGGGDASPAAQAAIERASFEQEQTKQDNEQLAAANENAVDSTMFGWQECIAAINGSLFSLSGINISELLRNIMAKIAEKACRYARTTSEQYIQEAFNKMTYSLPYGLGTLSPTGTIIAGQSMGGVHVTGWNDSGWVAGWKPNKVITTESLGSRMSTYMRLGTNAPNLNGGGIGGIIGDILN